MNSFNNANNFVVHNLNQTEYRASDVNGFKLLQDHVVKGAAHNAGERFDAPKCHPETRTAVLSSIKSWVDSNDKERIMWLHGPAGAGKSAIAQTTALDCDKEGKLAASFFFSRLAGRNKKDGLIATIAYQLSVSIPVIREHIIKNIERNPKIFEADIITQMQWLVVDPLSQGHERYAGVIIPRLIIIDGLDECEIRKDQVEIIESVSMSLSSVEFGSGLRVLLVSRPELEIRVAFNDDTISPLRTIVALDDSFNPDKDIELYLRSRFQTIKRQHTVGSLIPPFWPSDDSIQKLVTKSSGQFIYASTVITFISDAEHDPRKRLDTILQIRPAENDDKPYAQLDALYSVILSMCKDYAKVTAIFEAIMFTDNKEILKIVDNLEIFLSLKDEIMLLLANLHSIVDVNNISRHGIRFYHASLFDYLVDLSRSRELHIDRREGHVHLSMKGLNHLMSLWISEKNYAELREVVQHCTGSCFYHFKESGWDDRVFNFICKKNVLKPDNSQLEYMLSFHTSWRDAETISILSRLCDYVPPHNEENSLPVNNLRAIIHDEILNHLAKYPRKDIIYIYFLENEIYRDFCVAYELHTDFMKTYEIGFANIMKRDIFGDINVVRWVLEILHMTKYIQKIPEDIPVKSIFCILGLATEKRDRSLLDNIISLLHIIIDQNLPLSKNTSRALLEKWNVVGNVLRGLHDHKKVNEIERIIQRYCMCVEKDARNDRVENDARKDVLPANGNKITSGLKGLLSDLKRKIFRTGKH